MCSPYGPTPTASPPEGYRLHSRPGARGPRRRPEVHRMRLRMPSPAMVVALIALVVASSGTAFAVVNYARNAGAVDGRSAVSAGSSLGHAAGNVVATARTGRDKGRIPNRYLADVMR